jgi:hypothetical protein
MAAGMWQGLLAGYKDVEEKNAAREAKEEELMEKRKALALKIAALRGTNSFTGGTSGTTSEGSTGGGSTGGSIEHQAQVLKSQFNLSDETITRVAGTAGAAGLNQALEILERTRKRYSDLGQEMPKDVVTNLFDSAVLTGAPEDDLDFGKLEEYIGGALDPLERELLTLSRSSTGQAYFPEPSVLAPPKIEDLDRLERRAINAANQRATIEIQTINNALNNIRKTEESTTDPEALSELTQTKTWLISRQAQVKDALDSAAGDGGNPTGLVNLYGNEFLQQIFEADPTLSNGVLSPIFQEARSATPKRVDSIPQLRNLARLGVISVGDTVEILDPATGEYVLQTIGE